MGQGWPETVFKYLELVRLRWERFVWTGQKIKLKAGFRVAWAFPHIEHFHLQCKQRCVDALGTRRMYGDTAVRLPVKIWASGGESIPVSEVPLDLQAQGPEFSPPQVLAGQPWGYRPSNEKPRRKGTGQHSWWWHLKLSSDLHTDNLYIRVHLHIHEHTHVLIFLRTLYMSITPMSLPTLSIPNTHTHILFSEVKIEIIKAKESTHNVIRPTVTNKIPWALHLAIDYHKALVLSVGHWHRHLNSVSNKADSCNSNHSSTAVLSRPWAGGAPAQRGSRGAAWRNLCSCADRHFLGSFGLGSPLAYGSHSRVNRFLHFREIKS